MPHESKFPAGDRHFATTQWSVVVAAGATGESSQQALARLCEAYWYPLYAYVRRQVNDVHRAQDLTQAFFVHLLETHAIGKADRSRGRFRAFLLASLKNFLASEWEKGAAIKRGGGKIPLSLDWEAGESRYNIEPATSQTPEILYQRQWILTVINHVLAALQSELDAAGKENQFHELKECLTGQPEADQYERAAEALGISAAAAKQAAYRLRKRYRQLFRAEIARTVADEDEVEDEIGRLLEVLAG